MNLKPCENCGCMLWGLSCSISEDWHKGKESQILICGRCGKGYYERAYRIEGEIEELKRGYKVCEESLDWYIKQRSELLRKEKEYWKRIAGLQSKVKEAIKHIDSQDFLYKHLPESFCRDKVGKDDVKRFIENQLEILTKETK